MGSQIKTFFNESRLKIDIDIFFRKKGFVKSIMEASISTEDTSSIRVIFFEGLDVPMIYSLWPLFSIGTWILILSTVGKTNSINFGWISEFL